MERPEKILFSNDCVKPFVEVTGDEEVRMFVCASEKFAVVESIGL